MKLTIFGATGGIGRQLLELASPAGHELTAVVRDPSKLSADVRVIQADLAGPDPEALETAVDGGDAVLSALGPRTREDSGIAEKGTRAIVRAMQATGARRLVVVSAAPIGTVPSPDRPMPRKHDPGDGFFMRHVIAPILKTVFRERYADLARMEDVVRDSGLDWTIVRPVYLRDGPLTGSYRMAYGQNVRRGLRISRADVAHLMLRVLRKPETIKEVVGIAY